MDHKPHQTGLRDIRLLFVDLQVEQFKPLSNIFQTLRPDIAILNARGIVT